jgi:tetratricopeptide (TPR) repeat protein
MVRIFLKIMLPSQPDIVQNDAYWRCAQLTEMQSRIDGCNELLAQTTLPEIEQAYALTNRGLAFSEQGRQARAKVDFDRAIEILDAELRSNPEDIMILLNRGRAYRASGDLARGMADYDEAIRIDPLNADVYNSRCWARALDNIELDLARRDCDEALRLMGPDAAILDSRGLVSLKQRRFADAFADFDMAVRLQPGIGRYRYGRGVALLRLGERAKGEADIAEAIRREPDVVHIYEVFGVRREDEPKP